MTTSRTVILGITILLSGFCVWTAPVLFLKEQILAMVETRQDNTGIRFKASVPVVNLWVFLGVPTVTLLMQLTISVWALTSGIGMKFVALLVCISFVVRILLVLSAIGFRITVHKWQIYIHFKTIIRDGQTTEEAIGRILEGFVTLYLIYLFIVLAIQR
jgi:hypothetical protein